LIISQIVGGLGNQMFQYAYGRYLSRKHQTDLLLDISPFRTYSLHAFSLPHLSIKAGFATYADIRKYYPPHPVLRKIFDRITILHKLLPYGDLRFRQGNEFRFRSEYLELPDQSYVQGYWQSEKYFPEMESILRKEFQVKYPLAGKNLEIAEDMSGGETVAIHVRRGDYVSDAQAASIHGLCGLEYYHRAVDHIAERHTELRLFFFSDDPKWVVQNLHFPFPTKYVDHNDAGQNYEDLRLMSLCHHQILANSSFSWWAGWLNASPDKIVIAPRRWFASSGLDDSDIVPEGWVRL